MPRRGDRDAVISPGNQNEHAPQEPVMTPRVTRRMSKADPSVAAAVATNYAISQQTSNRSSLSIGRGESSNDARTRRDSPWPVSPSGRGRRGVRQQEDRATPSPRKRKRKADDDTESDEDREKPQDDSQHKQSEASDKGGQQNSPPKKKQYARKTCWLPPNAHQLVKYAAKKNASNEGRVSPSPRKRKSDVGTEDVSDEDGEEEQHDGQRKQFGGVAESEKQEAPLRQSARKSCWLPPDAYQLTKFAKLNEADRSPPRSRNSSDSEDSQPPQGIAGSSHHGRHGILQSMEQVPVALRTQTPFIEDMTPFIHDDYSNLGNAPKRVRFSRQGGCGRPGCNCGAIRRVVDNAPGEVQDLALMSTRRGRLGQFLDWNSDEDDPTRIVNVLI